MKLGCGKKGFLFISNYNALTIMGDYDKDLVNTDDTGKTLDLLESSEREDYERLVNRRLAKKEKN